MLKAKEGVIDIQSMQLVMSDEELGRLRARVHHDETLEKKIALMEVQLQQQSSQIYHSRELVKSFTAQLAAIKAIVTGSLVNVETAARSIGLAQMVFENPQPMTIQSLDFHNS